MIKSIRYFLQLFQVKSRMMGDPSYTSTIDCFVKTLKNDVRSIDFLFFSFFLTWCKKNHLIQKVREMWVSSLSQPYLFTNLPSSNVSFNFMLAGTSSILQRLYPKFWTIRFLECHHVSNSRTCICTHTHQFYCIILLFNFT